MDERILPAILFVGTGVSQQPRLFPVNASWHTRGRGPLAGDEEGRDAVVGPLATFSVAAEGDAGVPPP